MKVSESCYLCGSSEELTRDHVPPKCLFPEPRPSDLITVACCRECNNGLSTDDEAFRLWVSSSIFRSRQGDEIWKNKVLPSMTKPEKVKFANAIQVLVGSREISPGVSVPTFSIQTERLEKMLIRITKGLLNYFHPEKKRDVSFQVILPTFYELQIALELTQLMIPDQRGEGVFRFWRGFFQDEPNSGVWIYLFYGGACFIVFHGDGVWNSVSASSESSDP